MLLVCSLFIPAQQTVATATNGIVPPLVNFGGVLTDLNGKPLTGVVGVTFCLYQDQQGGSPVWLETQNVHPDSHGHYTVLLGSTSSDGLPTSIFASGEAHWLGVQVQGEGEQPRVLLVSAPYALKAGDAETLGGFPPSAFVRAAPPSGGAPATATAAANATVSASPSSSSITGTGTVNFVPLWDTPSDIVNSARFQSGTGSTAKIGINTPSPASSLDVQGAGTIRGLLSLPASGTATATTGANSQPLTLAASAFSSASSAAVNQTFQWQAEPAGNDTSLPSGTLNLLFGAGASKPSETGLQVASNGQIKFAAGQTFPGTGNGTITGVMAGTDLTGGGTSGSVTLSLNTSATDARYARPGTQATEDGIHGVTNASGGTGVLGKGAIDIQRVASTSTGLSGLFRGTVKITGDGNSLLAGDPGCG